jgi:rubredoxin
VKMPAGTVGVMKTMDACQASCFKGNSTYVCNRCFHEYDAAQDGRGSKFADLPDSWACPLCGAPKSAYVQRVGAGTGTGTEHWEHAQERHA